MGAEKAEKRIETRKRLDAYLNKFIGDEPFMVRAADISTTGIYLNKLIEPLLPQGSMVSLEFMLPNSKEVIWARGAVIRDGSRWGTEGTGIWFTILPRTFRNLIEDFVSQN